MQRNRRLIRWAILAVFSLSPIICNVVNAEVFYDDFNAPHDYIIKGVAGTGWDAFIGLDPNETVDALNADINHPGQLYIESTGAIWEPNWSPVGPFLYKEVAGDFIATVHVTDFAGTFENQVLHNDCFIMARVADLNAAGAGEDYECVHYFPTWVGNMGRDVDFDQNICCGTTPGEAEWGFIGRYWEGDDTFALAQEYLLLERRGNIFCFKISEDGVYWQSLDTSDSPFNVNGFCIERPDFDGLPLQVGLAHATYTDATGYVAFDDFTLYEYGPAIYVDASATSGANNGTSWDDAYIYLQDALCDPNLVSPVQIWVAEGTYKPDQGGGQTPGNREATFQLINDVAIYGGFPSGGGNWASRDPNLHQTILSGDLNADDEPNWVNNDENSYHVVTGSGTDANAVLDGFTITAGNANVAASGSGMYNSSGSPTVTNCTFTGNSAGHHGGGMLNTNNSSPTITYCNFSGNRAAGYGGGMYNYDNSPTVTNCTFSGNIALGGGGMCNQHCSSSPTVTNCTFTGNSAETGGGMYNTFSSPTLTNCTFIGNSAGGNGGGMSNRLNSSPTITDCAFNGNSAGQRGGGMYNDDFGSPTLTNCTFTGNTADWEGGGMYNYESSPTVTDCTFSGNSAESGGGMSSQGYSSPTLFNCTFSGSSAENGGGIHNYQSSPILTNCTFNGNSADYSGGGMYNNQSSPTVTNCAFNGNVAPDDGGGMYSVGSGFILTNCIFMENLACVGGGIYVSDSNVVMNNCTFSGNSASTTGGIFIDEYGASTLNNCILWGNSSNQIEVQEPGYATVTFSCIQGGWPGNGNIGDDPNDNPLFWDTKGHLLSNSPCRNAGDPNGDYSGQTDIDGQPRVIEGRVDIGADELPPAIWNIDTNEVYDTIQDAIDDANDGETIVIQCGTYTGWGNFAIEFLGKAITLRSSDPNDPNVVAATIIDCQGESSGFYFWNGEDTNSVLDGFSIINAYGAEGFGGGIYCSGSSPTINNCIISGTMTDYGGGGINCDFESSPTITGCTITANTNNVGSGSGIYCFGSSPTIIECTISGNTSTYGGGIYCGYSNPVISDSTIRDNSPDGVWIEPDSTVLILGTVHIISNNIVGEGSVQIDPDGSLDLDDAHVFCNMSGAGTMEIDLGAVATIDGDAIINLGDPCDPGVRGTIDCEGMLRVKDSGWITNARINITRATFENNAYISNSEIHVDSKAPYGTSVFADSNASFVDVNIYADGDRYMDLEPNLFDGNLVNVKIFVTITEGVGQSYGGLFECRGEPNLADVNLYDPNYDPNNEFFCPAMPGTIPDCNLRTWTLERLELIPGAKLNLTNRFPFLQYNGGTDYDVVYVKELILRQGSVLNTSYNNIYYDNLIIEPNAVITNLPLLGFSTINIAMDDQTEFIVRVTPNNYTDYNDPNYNRVHVERVEKRSPDPNGMMIMRNLLDLDPNSPDCNEVINARAKGLFSKTSEDEVFIRFEYLFCDPNGSGELAIYLTDIPELLDHNDPNRGQRYVVVDYLSHPPQGRPGSAGSGRFGVFKTVVSKEYLNFVRGTRMEFEFSGPAGTCILINNWDPGIRCTLVCGDVAGGLQEINAVDFLGVISECGCKIDKVVTMGGGEAGCLDSGSFCSDGYVTVEDAMSVGWVECGNLCPADIEIVDGLGGSFAYVLSYGASALQTADFNDYEGSLLVAGKRYNSSQQDFMSDRLYGFDKQGNLVSGPFTGSTDRLNGRLARDHQGELYQLNRELGLVRLSDSNSVIPTGSYDVNSEPRYSQPATIYVGLQGQAESCWGRPILDAAFDTDYVYVTPVVVAPDDNEPYIASAKLELDSNKTPPYNVLKIYDDPNTFNPSDSDNPNLTGLREIEVDANSNVYVINVYGDNESDILWAYDVNGTPQKLLSLTDINLPAPVAMHVSNTTGMLYLASSLNQPDANSASVYVLSSNDLTLVRTIDISYMGHITDITEDPTTGTLWVVGFRMPQIPSEADISSGSVLSQQPFYEPYLAAIPDGNEAAQAVCLSDYSDPNNDLAMPLSIVWTGFEEKCGGADLNDSNDVNFIDFAILALQWRQAPGTPSADIAPEDTGDGKVDLRDLAVFAEHWLESGCSNP